MLGNLAANLLVGESLGVSFAYSFADIVEVSVAFVFAPSISAIAELIRPKPLVRFLSGGVLLAPIASGLVATTLLRGQLNGHMLPNLANWFVSDALSLAIFTPAALVFWTGEVTQLLRADRPRKTGFFCCFWFASLQQAYSGKPAFHCCTGRSRQLCCWHSWPTSPVY
ncbi:hypothetical protein [Paraburkholderia sp. DGU8]|uniref:hypothetical protein n=1 Tax=Paraburkholderia sp. DGU8 TaxID=3161997 RepID=UPI003466BE32